MTDQPAVRQPLGALLQDWLRLHGITPSELASGLGLAAPHFEQLLAGREVLTLDLAAQLEDATGIAADELLRAEQLSRNRGNQ